MNLSFLRIRTAGTRFRFSPSDHRIDGVGGARVLNERSYRRGPQALATELRRDLVADLNCSIRSRAPSMIHF